MHGRATEQATKQCPNKFKLKPDSLFFSDKNIFTRLPGPLGRLPTETICHILELAMTVPYDTFFATGNASDGPFAEPKAYRFIDAEEAGPLNLEETLSSAVSELGDEAGNALQLNLQEPVPPQTPVHEEPAHPEPLGQPHHHPEAFGPLRDFTRNPFLSGYPAHQVATTFSPFVSHFFSVDPSHPSIGILDPSHPQFVFRAGDEHGFDSVAFHAWTPTSSASYHSSPRCLSTTTSTYRIPLMKWNHSTTCATLSKRYSSIT